MEKKLFSRIFLSLIVSILAISSGYAQVSGSGSIISQDRDVGEFTGISVSSGIDLDVKQGNKCSLVIEADDNLQEYIISEVRDNVLHIYVKKNSRIQMSHKMDAHVTVSELNKLSVSGGGDVESLNTITSDDLSIAISGGGDLSFDLNAGKVKCSLSGGGDASLDGEIKDLDATLSGGGDLVFDGTLGMLELSMSGGGDASISGGDHASSARLSVSGGGDVSMNMACETIKTSVSGGGDVSVDAGDNVNTASFHIAGGGDLDLELAAEECTVSVGGGGDASIKGSAVKCVTEIKSGGHLSASDFRTGSMKLNLTGGAGAKIHVEDELILNASGGSQVYLSGDPHINANLTGGSKVHKN
jgi:hypothetical protein